MKIPEKYKSTYLAFCDKYNINEDEPVEIIKDELGTLLIKVSVYIVMVFRDSYASYKIQNFVQL